MLIKSMEETIEKDAMNAENLDIIRRIIDDFESTQLKKCCDKRKPKTGRARKISRSDSIINRCRISPKNAARVLHRSYDGHFHTIHLQDVVKSADSLYLNICETNASVENADANSPKNLDNNNTSRRPTKVFIENNVSKVLDEAAAAAQKKHQEKVMKGVQEVCVEEGMFRDGRQWRSRTHVFW